MAGNTFDVRRFINLYTKGLNILVAFILLGADLRTDRLFLGVISCVRGTAGGGGGNTIKRA